MTEPRIQWIVEEAADVFGVSVIDLLSKRRDRPVARARQSAMWVAKHLTRHSLPEIGRALGDRCHTTVMHGCRKIESLLDEGDHIESKVRLLVALSRTRAINEQEAMRGTNS
ncbi:MAG: helix-turn-helix domain-containing protein [Pseudorhodoplanes sp.]